MRALKAINAARRRGWSRRASAVLLAGALVGWSGSAAAQGAPGPAAAPAPATAPAGSPEDVERLRERAAAFWAARVASDPVKQWELLEPRGRGRLTAPEYGGMPRALKYLAYQVDDASVRGYFATVKVRLIVQPLLPVARQRRAAPAAVVVDDTWVKIQGTWYRSLEQESGRGPGDGQQ